MATYIKIAAEERMAANTHLFITFVFICVIRAVDLRDLPRRRFSKSRPWARRLAHDHDGIRENQDLMGVGVARVYSNFSMPKPGGGI